MLLSPVKSSRRFRNKFGLWKNLAKVPLRKINVFKVSNAFLAWLTKRQGYQAINHLKACKPKNTCFSYTM